MLEFVEFIVIIIFAGLLFKRYCIPVIEEEKKQTYLRTKELEARIKFYDRVVFVTCEQGNVEHVEKKLNDSRYL